MDDRNPIDELIIRSLQGCTTDAEETVLGAWRAESPGNERKYQEMARVWELTSAAAPSWEGQVPSLGELLGSEGEDPALHPVGRSENPEDQIPRPADRIASSSSRRSLRPTWLVASAAAIALIGFGIGLGVSTNRDSFLSHSEIVTGAGEMTTLSLGDGSTIRLGPRSRLRLLEKDNERFAQLDVGRAFFGVESDPSRPFTVRTSYGDAEATGTRFEVRTEEEEFRVLVVEGSVAVSAGGSEVRLSESQMSRSQAGGSPTTERVSDVFQHLDWLGNTLVFQATPVGRAFREIERRYGVEIVIDDPSISRLTVTAAFTAQSVDDVVQIICEIIGARCLTDGETVRVSVFGTSTAAKV